MTRHADQALDSGLDVGDASIREAGEVLEALSSDAESGLSESEAARRLTENGPNELASAPPVPAWRRFLAQFQDPLIYLLLGAIVISLLAFVAEGDGGVPVDAIVIVLIVIANAVLGFVQEARAADAVAALQGMAAPTSTVIRDGSPHPIPTRELVVGDLLVLAEGDSVGADARLVRSAHLKLAEASLTGESEAVTKDVETLAEPAPLGDRTSMVFNGTACVRGTGRAVVTATGMGTEMGQIAGLLADTHTDPTPLQREIARVGRTLGIAVIVIAVVVMATVLLTSDVEGPEDLVTVLLLGVSLAVAAVPEGLPAILSVILAIGVQRMAARNAIVKNLSSVETLGSASVICSDKTGTLTRGEMTIQQVLTSAGGAAVTGVGYQPIGELEVADDLADGDAVRHASREVLRVGSLANDASLTEDDGEWSIGGDPTEAAFLVAHAKVSEGGSSGSGDFARTGEVPFTSERKMMSVLGPDPAHDGTLRVFAKGAPEVLLDRCSHLMTPDGRRSLEPADREQITSDVRALSSEAYRTLGVAYGDVEGTEPPEDLETLERDLVYAGTVAIIDPPRAEAAAAIAAAHRAGIRIVMITGDHPLTARTIARDLGIVGKDAPVVTGTEIEAMDDDALAAAVAETSVFARVAPVHKNRIVDALQAQGQIVAMTGDGVNDAPAVKSADIGVAMGITGTEVTKQAAAMILADDDFVTIVAAVRQGRSIFDNIKKFLRFLITSNLGEVLTVFFGVVLAGALGIADNGEGLVLPLLATQILWINLLTDTAPALAMGIDPETDDVMARPPRQLTERVIDARMWSGAVIIGVVMAAVSLLAIDLFLPGGLVEGTGTLELARTAGFTTLVLAQLFNTVNSRSETRTAFHRLFVNRWLWGAIGLSLILQIAVVHLPFMQTAFSTAPLSLTQWLTCIALASAVLWADELRKLAHRAFAGR